MARQSPQPGAPGSLAQGGALLPDFAATWRRYLETRPESSRRRLDADGDRAFWSGYAARYDDGDRQAGAAATLSLLQGIVRPEDTLLDLGAGTGRFTLPLAQRAGRVTALDASPHMLEILRRKAASQGIQNVEVVEGDLASTPLPAHDVVLAAWSLYRQVDLLAGLEKLVAAARRTLVIVSGAAPSPPHRPLVRAIWGSDGEYELPSHLLFAGALWQLGIFAETRLAHERHVASGTTPLDVASRFGTSRVALPRHAPPRRRLPGSRARWSPCCAAPAQAGRMSMCPR